MRRALGRRYEVKMMWFDTCKFLCEHELSPGSRASWSPGLETIRTNHTKECRTHGDRPCREQQSLQLPGSPGRRKRRRSSAP